MANDKPVTRKERFLAGAAGEDITLDTPITREERFLAKAAGMDVKTDDPVTRSEKYLAKIAEGGGGGGGSVPEYEGAYTVTPSEQAQTLSCKNKKMTDDVSVSAISSTYIGSGVTQKAAATYTPTTSDQTIAANQYLSGAQTVKGDANLVSGNIKKDTQIFGVTGTYEGSGGGGSAQNLYGEFFFKKTITDSGFPFIVPQPDPYDSDAMDAYMEQDLRPYIAWVGIEYADQNTYPNIAYGFCFVEFDAGSGCLSLCIATRPEDDGEITLMDGGLQEIATDMENDGVYEFNMSNGNFRWALLNDTNGERNESYYADLLAWVNSNAFKTGDP